MRRLAIPLFVFLLLNISIAYAYLPLDVNISLGWISSNRYLQCINSTDDNNIYCFYQTQEYVSVWRNKLIRVNISGLDSQICTFNTTTVGNTNYQFAVVNYTTAYKNWGNAYCEWWDITNIASGNCTMLSKTSNCPNAPTTAPRIADDGGGQLDIADNYIYKTGSISHKGKYLISNFSYLNTTTIANSFDWGYGTKWLYGLTTPDDSSSSEIYVYGIGSVGGKYPNSPLYYYQDGVLTAQIDSPQDMYGICLGNASCYISMIKGDNVTYEYIFDVTNYRFYRANLTSNSSYSSSCSWNNEVLGATCTGQNTYKVNYDNCNVTEYNCPSNSYCVQTTPQIVWNGQAIENFTNCAQASSGLSGFYCNSIFPLRCYLNPSSCSPTLKPYWSNCPAECQYWFTYTDPNYPLTHNLFATTAPPNITTYTISCVDSLANEIFSVNSTGSETTIADIIGNQTGYRPCENTTSICYDAQCIAIQCSDAGLQPPGRTGTPATLAVAFNSLLGTSFGAQIIAFITSVGAAFVIFFKTKAKNFNYFIVPFFLFLGGFSMPGVEFFPQWLFLVMVTFTGVMIFWKARG